MLKVPCFHLRLLRALSALLWGWKKAQSETTLGESQAQLGPGVETSRVRKGREGPQRVPDPPSTAFSSPDEPTFLPALP